MKKKLLTLLAVASLFAIEVNAQTPNSGTWGNVAGGIPTYTTNGKVGIGTNAPTAFLSLANTKSNCKFALYDDIVNNGATSYGFGIQDYQFRLHLGLPDARFSFYPSKDAATELMTIQGTGNVGINEAYPSDRLDVNTGSSNEGIRIRRLTSYIKLTAGLSSGGFNPITLANDAGIIFANTNGINQAPNGFVIAPWRNNMAGLRMDQYGNVGIGTNCTGGAMLAVNGKISAKEINVVLPNGYCFPDYVFEKNYDLRPLSEVAKYIDENKHLPEVPSASQVETNGVNLGEMDAILLKKVEELTLYMIEMKKENEELKKEVNALKLSKN